MLDREELVQAIDLHRRSYNLLRWLRTAIARGVIRFDRAHDYMDEAEAAEDWIREHYFNFPPACRPEQERITAFSRFFVTYLITSFDLVEQPMVRGTSPCGCWCRLCMYLVSASHLRTKKLLRRDKERARKLKVTTLQQLSFKHNLHLDQHHAEEIINSPQRAMDASLLAYGQQLLERAHGRSQGPAVLALWREIAWTQTAPKKDFELNAEDILNAEDALVHAITEVKAKSIS